MREVDGGARVDCAYQIRLRKDHPAAEVLTELAKIQGLSDIQFMMQDATTRCKMNFIRSHKMIIAWVVAVLSLVTLGFFYKGETVIFTGIAEASETVVSVQNAVEIVKVHVIPGQEVKDGDTLVELSRPDLALRMNEVTRELDALEGRGSLNTATIDQKVAEVQADLSTRRNTILFEIEKLNSEYKQNREIAAKLKSLSASSLTAADSNDAMMMRIRNLQKELKVLEESASSQIRLLRGSKGLQQTSSARKRMRSAVNWICLKRIRKI
jgi:HlyD family secretion protein